MALDSFDPAHLFGREVLAASGQRIGRVTALVHRGDGCDVLIDRRRLLRHTVVRVDLDDLVQVDAHRYRVDPAKRRAAGPSDDRVA